MVFRGSWNAARVLFGVRALLGDCHSVLDGCQVVVMLFRMVARAFLDGCQGVLDEWLLEHCKVFVRVF